VSPSPDQRITALKVVGWALRVLTVSIIAVLLIQAADFILGVTRIGTFSDLLSLVSQFVPLMVAIGLLEWGSRHLFRQAEEIQSDLELKLTGYITSNQSTSIETLSKWTGLPQRKTADMAARLAAGGNLVGYTIDIPSQTIFRGSAPHTPNDTPYTPPRSIRSPVAPIPDSSDETTRVKAKLYELDLLKKQGRISEEEYNEMKGELERKLTNLDSGTQVY
jgi:hypothetical protein